MKDYEEIQKAEMELMEAAIKIAEKHDFGIDDVYAMHSGVCSKVFATMANCMTDKVKDKHAYMDELIDAFRSDVHSYMEEL